MLRDVKARASGFLDTIANGYAIVGSLLIACVGTAYAMKSDAPWLAFCLLLPLTTSALCAARKWWREAQQANDRFASEQSEHDVTRRKAEQAASEALGDVRDLLRQYSLGNAANAIRRSIHLLSRMRSLQNAWESTPTLRKLTEVSQELYATIKIPLPAIEYIQEGDTFGLVEMCKDKVRRDVAMLQVHQEPDPKTGAVIIKVTFVVNVDTVEALRALARTGTKCPSGFTVSLPFDVRPFANQDLAAADALLTMMMREFDDVYLAEVQND